MAGDGFGPYPTWVFSRGTVTISLQRRPPFVLHITSSEGNERMFTFSDIDEVTAFQSGFEQHLVATDWSLVAFGPERRRIHSGALSGPERRKHPEA